MIFVIGLSLLPSPPHKITAVFIDLNILKVIYNIKKNMIVIIFNNEKNFNNR